uniref:Uncharacterized protein n=1 Tax=Arion vulgaris TaxID=1028688 RepID=A0A0B6Z9J7_9EUPU
MNSDLLLVIYKTLQIPKLYCNLYFLRCGANILEGCVMQDLVSVYGSGLSLQFEASHTCDLLVFYFLFEEEILPLIVSTQI